MTRKLRTGILAAIGLLALILDTKTALQGASDGLQLCIRTVMPSLFPFFVLSNLLTSTLTGQPIPLLRPLWRVFGIVPGSESLLLIGMLGGYPAGAQCVTQANLPRWDAERMLSFCNLAGPAFLFGIVAGKFSNRNAAWFLWGIHILSALFTAILLPGRSTQSVTLKPKEALSLTEAVQRSLRTMVGICGWIVLFRVLIAFANRWILWLLPIPLQVAITGFLELSNGCCDLGRIQDENLRFIISAGMLAFGGLCVTMQTASVTEDLSLKTYLAGKIIQVLFSILLACLILAKQFQIPLLLWILLPTTIIVTVKFLHKKEKRYSISRLVGV